MPGHALGAAYPGGQSVGGLMAELSGRLFAMTPPMDEVRPCAQENFGAEIQCDHDAATIAMFDMLEEADVETCTGTTVTGPLVDWTLTLDGEVENPVTLDWAAFNALLQRDFVTDIHCVTRWSKLDTRWKGVDFSVLFELAKPDRTARFVQAQADGGYSANLRLEDLLNGRAIVATEFDGQPLSTQHGGPARLVAPRLYFWKSAKWLRGLHFSQYDFKGYWEKLGYHNYGDPWKEQRYR